MSKQDKEKSEIIDITPLLRLYASKWYYFVISVIVCCGLAFLYNKVRHEVFMVKANVLISQDDSGSSSPSMASALSAFSGGLFGGNPDVLDEVFIVSSHSVLRDVVRDMGINRYHQTREYFIFRDFRYDDYPVDVLSNAPALPDTLSTAIAFKMKISADGKIRIKVKADGSTIAEVEADKFPVPIKTIYGDFTAIKTKDFVEGEPLNTIVLFRGYHEAAEVIAEDLTIDIASKNSNVIGLSVESSNREYAKDLINNIIRKYNERSAADKRNKGMRTTEFIDERLDMLSGELSSAEDHVEQFKRDHNLVDLTSEITYQMTKKGTLENELIEAMTQQEILRMTRDFITDPENAYSIIPGFRGSEALSEALASYNDLILKRIDLMQNAKGENAQLRSINAQIDAMRGSINESLRKEYQNSTVTLKNLQNQYGSTDTRLGNVPSYEKAFRTMSRQRMVKEQLYVYLLQQREQSAMMMANTLDKGQVVDEAYALKDTVGLSPLAILFIAFVFGLCIPPAWFYLHKLLRNKPTSKEDVEEYTSLPVLGDVCEDKNGNAVVEDTPEDSSAAEKFRVLRSNLLFEFNDPADKVVLVTSLSANQGKTFVATNLATSLSYLEHKKVLLIGMDLRHPELGDYLDIHSNRGLADYLSSDSVTLRDITLQSPFSQNLDIILAGTIPHNPSELLLSKKAEKMMEQLRDIYDVIVIDAAALGTVSDTLSLDRLSDATIFVCRVNHIGFKEISRIEDVASEKRLKRVSIVVNSTPVKKKHSFLKKS